MESYLLDWANLLLRWVHVITAIAWIGSSLYFVFLDSSLTPPEDDDLKKQGVSGELWAVHGGGFYHPVKFAGAPPKLPGNLHWFYWESYSTWLTGFALFTVSYLWSAGTYLIDKSVMAWHPHAAIAVALSFLVVFWLAYDGICRVFGKRKHGDAIVGALVAVNALGAVTVDDGPHFWAAPYEVGTEFGGLGLPPCVTPDDLAPRLKGMPPPATATTIGLIATDATLTQAQAQRMATAAHDGMARAIVPSHTPLDGDLVFAAATHAKPLQDPLTDTFQLGHAAATCLARAIARAIYSATPQPADLQPTWASRHGR